MLDYNLSYYRHIITKILSRINTMEWAFLFVCLNHSKVNKSCCHQTQYTIKLGDVVPFLTHRVYLGWVIAIAPHVRSSERLCVCPENFLNTNDNFWYRHTRRSWRFFHFWEKKNLGLTSLFSCHFSNRKGLTREALQVVWCMLACFCLYILNLRSGTSGNFFQSFKKSFCWL